MEIIVHLNAKFAEWDYNIFPSQLQFNEPSSMKILGNIHSIFMSTSSIMRYNIKKVKGVQIIQKRYMDLEVKTVSP
jgi:hypothetical protein